MECHPESVEFLQPCDTQQQLTGGRTAEGPRQSLYCLKAGLLACLTLVACMVLTGRGRFVSQQSSLKSAGNVSKAVVNLESSLKKKKTNLTGVVLVPGADIVVAAAESLLGGNTSAGADAPRKGSFLVLGDWGYDHEIHGNAIPACQKKIADLMLTTMQELGDVKFVVNVGDSFYPRGVKNKFDWQWDAKWRRVYAPELRAVPWYSVYGNHDYQSDPCACASDARHCAQVHTNTSDRNFFYMPSYNFFVAHPELDLEVVAMDLNDYMWGWFRKAPEHSKCAWDCGYSPCQKGCEQHLRTRAEEAEKLLKERMATSTAKNLVVFSHYPTDYLSSNPGLLATLSDASKHHIEYFGGHRHNVDQNSTISIAPNNNWLVGGGGGWSCDVLKGIPSQQGFVVGEINALGQITTRAVLINNSACCIKPPPAPAPRPGPKPAWPPRCLSKAR